MKEKSIPDSLLGFGCLLPVSSHHLLSMCISVSKYPLYKDTRHIGLQEKALVDQLCPTLCDPMDCSPPGFSVHGILQARILEWVAISFSRGSS